MAKHYVAIGVSVVALAGAFLLHEQANPVKANLARNQHVLAQTKKQVANQHNHAHVTKKTLKSNLGQIETAGKQVTQAQQWFMQHIQDPDQGIHEPQYRQCQKTLEKYVNDQPANSGWQPTKGAWIQNLKGANIDFQIKGENGAGDYQVQWVYTDPKSHAIWGIVFGTYSPSTHRFDNLNCVTTAEGAQQNQLIGGK